jgi:integrase
VAKTLTAAAVQKLKARGKRREVRDGASTGLYLILQASGHKSWAMRFRRPDGSPAKLTLGPVDFSGAELEGSPQIGMPLSLPAARQLAAEVHRQRALGRDVVADIKTVKRHRRDLVEEDSANSFAVLARRYVDEHARDRTRSWRITARLLGLKYINMDAEPEVLADGLVARWGDRPATSITVGDVHDVIDEARDSLTPGAAGKARRKTPKSDSAARAMTGTLSKLFNWMVEKRKIATSPAAGIKAKPAPARDRVLTDDEIKSFWHAAGQEQPEFAAPLKLLLLTGCRVNEVGGMRRDELSKDLSTWTIPKERTKNKRQHVVHLPPIARGLIPAATGEGDHVFSTTRGLRPVELGSKVKHRLDARMTAPRWVLHDLRRTAVTGMVELGISTHVVELVVNHVSGARAGVAGIYNRAVMMPERKAAMERWTNHVAGIVSDRPANVVSIGRAS